MLMIRYFKNLIVTLLLVIASAAGAWAQPTSGSGTSGDPYLIGTAADLKAFAEYVNADHWTACAKLTADIDLSTVCSETLGNWPGIGTSGYSYRGVFDGQDHTITGLYINATEGYYYGLFRSIEGAHISHLKLAGNVSVVNESGILIGRSRGSSCLVEDVEILSGSSITGAAFIGGIVGQIENGTFNRCVNRASVTSTNSKSAGIAGHMTLGSITRCANYGLITNSYYNGAGIVGSMAEATVSGCANYGDVKGQYEVGGLVGNASNSGGVIENCLQTGNVTGYSGGGITYSTYAALRNCLQMGNVTIEDQRGGFLVAYEENMANYSGNCYLSTATFTWKRKVDETSKVSGINLSLGNITTALIDADLASGKAAFLLQGEQATTFWTQNIGTEALPTPLRESGNEVYFNGTMACDGTMTGSFSNTLNGGTTRQDHDYDANGLCTHCGDGQAPALVDEKYQIATVGNLLWLRDEINLHRTTNLKAVQTADLDLSCVCGPEKGNWTPIGDYVVSGNNGALNLNYDGQGHSISGLYIDNTELRSEIHGLFGIVYSSTISNLNLAGCHINLPHVSSVGALVGHSSSSTVSGVTVADDCSVTGYVQVGGIVGSNYGTVVNCSNYAPVKANQKVGGIVGYLSGDNASVSLCYNAGTIQGIDVSTDTYNNNTKDAGGICGACNSATISRCENDGDVTTYYKAAGICADQQSGTVADCASSGTMTAYEQAGGICAWVYGKVTDCLFTGNVSQTGSSSSYHGLVIAWANVPGNVTNCFFSADSKISCERGSETPSACFSVNVTGAQSVSHSVLVGGEVAFKLQGVRPDLVWSQGLNGTNLPTVLYDPSDPQHVYLFTGTTDCAGNLLTPATYANSVGPSAVYLDHVYGDDGVCTVCGELQAPELIDGVYHINNYANLALFRDHVNAGNYTASAVLNANIDLAPFCSAEKGNFTPFKDFRGNFDGQGHKISGFYFDHSKHNPRSYDGIGLFLQAGTNDADTEICNLELEGYVDSQSYAKAALLVGQAKGRLSVHHVTTRGEVLGQGSTGGVVGYMSGSSSAHDCVNYASVSGGTNPGQGGIVGLILSNAAQTTLTNLANYGKVSGNDLVGGVVGYKQDSQKLTLRNVANYGNISGARVAGIIGSYGSDITVDGAYCSGNIDGTSNSGVVMPNASSASAITRVFYDASLTLNSVSSPVDVSTSADYGKSIGVSHDDVVAGRAAYLLGEGFGQQLPGGTMPVIGGPRVYYGRYQHAVAEPIFSENQYSNIIVGETPTDHDFKHGVCTICGKHNGEVYDGPNVTFENWTSKNQGQDGSTYASAKAAYDLGTVAVGATLTFDWKVSSEARYDKFYASICNYYDDTEVSKLVDAKSGEMSGKVDHSFTTSGHYYLKLWYTKDNSTSGGSDTATATNIKYVNLALVPGEVWADLNGDADFDVDDVNTLRSMVLGESAEDPKADLNGDGEVTIGDVTEAIHQLIMP